MPSEFANAVALQREVFAVSLDPITSRETKRGFLQVGTLIDDPRRAIADAVARSVVEIIVRTKDPTGWVGLERVHAAALRAALPLMK